MTTYKSPETKIYNTILAKCQYPREASSGVYFARKGKRQHQTPSGLFQSSLYNHRDNLYIISYFFGFREKKVGVGLVEWGRIATFVFHIQNKHFSNLNNYAQQNDSRRSARH